MLMYHWVEMSDPHQCLPYFETLRKWKFDYLEIVAHFHSYELRMILDALSINI